MRRDPRPLIFALLVALVAGVLAPLLVLAPVSARPSEFPADAPVVLRAKDVVATSHSATSGTTVDVAFTVANRTARRQDGEKVLLFLNAGGQTRSLGTGRTPSVPGGGSREIELTATVGPQVPAGRYSVMVCLVRRERGRCAATTGKPVRVDRATLVADQSALSWDPVAVGTAGPARTVTLTNSGRSWTGRLTMRVDDPTFTRGSECLGRRHGLAPGASCTMTVTAAPKVAGPRAGTLVITGPGVKPVSIGLRAVGLAPAALALTPATRQFGGTPTGVATEPVMFTLTNTGGQPSGVPAVDLGGSTDFTVTANGCTAVLPAGGSCQLRVAFVPGSTGDKDATLAVAATPGGTTTARLSGTGLAPAQLVLTQTPGNFPSTQVDTTSPVVTYVFRNTGAVATGVPAVTLTPTTDFAIATNHCDAAVAPMDTCTVEVSFTPTQANTRAATLSVTATPGGTATAEARGVGLAPARFSIRTSADSFPDTPVESSSPSPITIFLENVGEVATTKLDISLTNTTDFNLDRFDCLQQLEVRSSCTIHVGFRPSKTGERSTRVQIDGGSGVTAEVTLTGTGVQPATLTVTPSPLDFGDEATGIAKGRPLTVRNSGDVRSAVPDVSLLEAPDFQIVQDECTAELDPGATCTVQVSFRPKTSGDRTGQLLVQAGQASAEVTLTGHGTLESGAKLIIGKADSTRVPDTVVGKQSADLTFILTNGGDRDTKILDYFADGDFVVISECLLPTSVLAAGTSCEFRLAFKPTATGQRFGSISMVGSIMPDQRTTLTVRQNLSGLGVAPP